MILIDNRNNANPYFNLALEEYAIRHLDARDEDYLLFYINRPCIVLGKNQSIYKEVNFEYLRNNQLALARRISGGGTVYHDEGNLNFSIISKFEESKVNNYRYFNQPVIDALKKAGIETEMDTRNNIISGGKKISGSAQFTNRKNINSHGTLLYNANLQVLRAALKQNSFKIESRAVSSVSSPVANISDLTKRFSSARELKDFLSDALNATSTYNLSDKEWNTVEQLASEKFESFEWVYGRSPRTIIEKEGLTIEVEDGLITHIEGIAPLLPKLNGVRYEYQAILKSLENTGLPPELACKIF